jgi:hypothetical protein
MLIVSCGRRRYPWATFGSRAYAALCPQRGFGVLVKLERRKEKEKEVMRIESIARFRLVGGGALGVVTGLAA